MRGENTAPDVPGLGLYGASPCPGTPALQFLCRLLESYDSGD